MFSSSRAVSLLIATTYSAVIFANTSDSSHLSRGNCTTEYGGCLKCDDALDASDTNTVLTCADDAKETACVVNKVAKVADIAEEVSEGVEDVTYSSPQRKILQKEKVLQKKHADAVKEEKRIANQRRLCKGIKEENRDQTRVLRVSGEKGSNGCGKGISKNGKSRGDGRNNTLSSASAKKSLEKGVAESSEKASQQEKSHADGEKGRTAAVRASVAKNGEKKKSFLDGVSVRKGIFVGGMIGWMNVTGDKRPSFKPISNMIAGEPPEMPDGLTDEEIEEFNAYEEFFCSLCDVYEYTKKNFYLQPAISLVLQVGYLHCAISAYVSFKTLEDSIYQLSVGYHITNRHVVAFSTKLIRLESDPQHLFGSRKIVLGLEYVYQLQSCRVTAGVDFLGGHTWKPHYVGLQVTTMFKIM